MNKTVITNLNQFQDWWVSAYRPIMSLDFEATSLNYLDMELVGCSLASDVAVCYIPAGSIDLNNLKICIEDIDLLVMHNAPFDLKCLYKFFDYTPQNIFCTLIGAQLLDENLPSHSLKYLAEYWLGIPADQIKKWEEVSIDVTSPKFMDYAMNDAIWAYQLYELESKELKKQNLEHLFYTVEMPFQFVLRDLEINGIAADKEKLEDYKNECRTIIDSIESDMLRIFNKTHIIQKDLFGGQTLVSPINFRSNQQLVTCFNKLGVKVIDKTRKGNLSADKHVLTSLKGKHKFIDLLIRFRKLSTLYNTFISRIEDFIDSDNRVRPSYRTVRTGRLSCSEPNLQNQPNPKKEKLEFNYRKIFIPGD